MKYGVLINNIIAIAASEQVFGELRAVFVSERGLPLEFKVQTQNRTQEVRPWTWGADCV